MYELEPDYEYEYARDVLRHLAEMLLEYPLIKDLPQEGSLENYLKGVARVIGGLLAFEHRGVGKSSVFDQITTQLNAFVISRLPDPGYKFSGIDNDCKLPASVTAAVVEELAARNHWPLRAECIVMRSDPHAFITVHVDPTANPDAMPFSYSPADYFLIDFESMKDRSFSRVQPHAENTYQDLVDYGYVKRSTNLVDGLRLYDAQYYQALQQQDEHDTP